MCSQKEVFYHALEFRKDLCAGCSHCMMRCPTEAIRVVNGKAELNPDRCIDCGECYRICPSGAITVGQDDFEQIYHYRYRVALMPAVFTAQFPEKITACQIYQALNWVGFTHIFETEYTAGSLINPYNEYIVRSEEKPVISSFCPAIIRLIQVRFPTLVDHIMLIKPPMDVTAMYIKAKFEDEGIDFSDVGIFYITPCAAKIAGIKSSVVEEHSLVRGVINMNYLYNKVYRAIKQNNFSETDTNSHNFFVSLSDHSLRWSFTNGDTRIVESSHKIAIDQIQNVIEFLEKVENEDVKDIDFLELRACYQSCAGGILCAGNKFLTSDRARRRAQNNMESTVLDDQYDKYAHYLEQHCLLSGKIMPRSIIKLDNDMAEAMKKMKRINAINKILPQVDCGLCGSPSCASFAEDMVQHNAEIKKCIFIQKILLQNDKIDSHEAAEQMKQIWGVGKLDKNLIAELSKEMDI
jgi:iron only hydrogenase large subunit-like protein